jgi:hypothetical protein
MPSKTKSWSEAWDDRSRVQLEERKRLGLEPPPKKTMREIEDDCAAHGIFMSGWKARQRTTGGETPESVRAKSGLTREQWDAIPDAKLVDQWIPAPQWGAAALERAKSSGASQCPPAPERDPRPSPAPLTASGLDAFDRL